MTFSFKITGKQEYVTGKDQETGALLTDTNFTLTPVSGQGILGNLTIVITEQAAANALNFGDIMTVTVAKEV